MHLSLRYNFGKLADIRVVCYIPDIKVHGANLGRTWALSPVGGLHIGLINLIIWDDINGGLRLIPII